LSPVFEVAVGLDGVVRAADTPLPWTVQAAGWLNYYGRLTLALVLAAFAVGWAFVASLARRRLAQAG
jgi:hypothetical protein